MQYLQTNVLSTNKNESVLSWYRFYPNGISKLEHLDQNSQNALKSALSDILKDSYLPSEALTTYRILKNVRSHPNIHPATPSQIIQQALLNLEADGKVKRLSFDSMSVQKGAIYYKWITTQTPIPDPVLSQILPEGTPI